MAAMLLADHALDGLYARTLEGKPIREASAPQGEQAYAHFDDPAFHKLYLREAQGGSLVSIDLYLEGIHCAACIWLLEKLPSLMQGIVEARVDFRRSALHLLFDPKQASLSSIALLIDRLGYPPHPYRDLYKSSHQQQEDRRILIRIALTGAIAGNVMLLAFALYSSLFSEMEATYQHLFRYLSLILTIPSMIWGGSVFFRSAIGAIRARSLHIDQPIALGLAAGFAWSAFNTLRGTGEIYFDSVTALIFLLLVGRWLQRRQQRFASQATELLYSLSPSHATRIDAQGQRQQVAVEALQEGDLVEIRAGESFPADGIVSQGRSQIDTSLLTGESRPITIEEGEEVFAGTLNLGAALRVKIARAGSESRLGQILQQVEEASQKRAPIVQLADRMAGRFVVAVMVLAVFTALLWAYLDPSKALEHAVALLIICCPCALALATPLAIGVSIGRAAKQGILIKGGSLLEALASPGQIWLDKTGTLTEGRYRLLGWYGTLEIPTAAKSPQTQENDTPSASFENAPLPQRDHQALPARDEQAQPSLPALVQALEMQIAHPIARTLAAALPSVPDITFDAVEHRVGEGLSARYEGKELSLLSPSAYIRRYGALHSAHQEQLDTITQDGLTPVLIALDGRLTAIAALGDPLRLDAAPVLRALEADGWKIGILSGDHPHVVAAVAQKLKLDPAHCHGGLSPEDKLHFVTSSTTQPVVMIGDGVNDAAALSAATVGIGVHGGAEACLAIADIYLARPGLLPLQETIQGAQRTLKTIRRNLAFSLSYNLLGATLAVAGLIGPLAAAILMPLSSLTVVTLSFYSRTFPREIPKENKLCEIPSTSLAA
jgi:Cu2+-exporting ATPase